jgi:hypothetical protein
LCHNPIWQKPKSCQTGQLYAFAKLAAGFDLLWLRGGATRKEREAGEPKKNWPGVEAKVFHKRAIRRVVTGIGPGAYSATFETADGPFCQEARVADLLNRNQIQPTWKRLYRWIAGLL